jgi:hypothetical protein
MKQIAFIFSIIALAASLGSCNTKVKEERSQRIDSLGIHLNHVEEVLAQVDTVALRNWASTIKQTEIWLWDNIEDTLEARPGIVLGDFFRTNKFIGKVGSRYRDVKKEAAYSKTQIATLREDVKNNFYSEEEFRGYFSAEADAIAKLIEACDELENGNDLLQTRYKTIYPEATAVIDSIKAVIYDPKPRAK